MTRPDRRGAALLIVAALLAVATAVAAAVTASAIRSARQVRLDARAVQADRLADAGLARAAVRLGLDPGYAGEDWAAELPDGELAAVAIRVDRDAAAVTATAVYPAGVDRPVRITRTTPLEPPNTDPVTRPAG